MSSQPHVTAQDAVQVAQKAMQRCNEMETELANLQTHTEQLEQRVEQLELVVPDPTDYGSLTKAEKGSLVREHLVRKAQDNNGKAKVDYKEIKHGVFDGQPSDGHCFDLMDAAARKAGFVVKDPSRGNKHVRVDLAKTSTERESTGLSRTKNG